MLYAPEIAVTSSSVHKSAYTLLRITNLENTAVNCASDIQRSGAVEVFRRMSVHVGEETVRVKEACVCVEVSLVTIPERPYVRAY